jgi:hypothetical protein
MNAQWWILIIIFHAAIAPLSFERVLNYSRPWHLVTSFAPGGFGFICIGISGIDVPPLEELQVRCNVSNNVPKSPGNSSGRSRYQSKESLFTMIKTASILVMPGSMRYWSRPGHVSPSPRTVHAAMSIWSRSSAASKKRRIGRSCGSRKIFGHYRPS